MRLIDADAIEYTMLYKENWLKGTGVEDQAVWKKTIDEMPTIEAIPVEWIRKYTEENRLYQSDDFDLYISDMIADWAERKEE